MSQQFRGYAVGGRGEPLKLQDFDPGPLGDEQVEVQVSHCGICHSDLSMIENDWGMTAYPLVPGHEAVGEVVATGPKVKGLKTGDRVGVGWLSGSCLSCPQCLGGNQNLCPNSEATIVNRPGGFADRLRCHWAWAVRVPEAISSEKAGPLFCGGLTVFHPMLAFGVKPTDRVGVIGIGGLGHLAVQFLNKWGCEVYAFSSSEAKREEALRLGAHHVVSSRTASDLRRLPGSLDFIISTVNVALDWGAYLEALAPGGRFHVVGAVLQPIEVGAMSLIGGQKSVSGSPVGSPSSITRMLEFCARHKIAPMTELFPMSEANQALDHLRSGEARYRVVLKADFT
jgi:alcohol/geraniol dehydrogenase (NADP+)